MAQTKITQEKLLALKLTEGKSVKKFVSEFDATNMFRGVSVCKNASDQGTFDNLKARFRQALIDNVVRVSLQPISFRQQRC